MTVQLPPFISKMTRSTALTTFQDVLPRCFWPNIHGMEDPSGPSGFVALRSLEETDFVLTAKPTISISAEGKILASENPQAIAKNVEIITSVLNERNWLEQELTAIANPYTDSTGKPIPPFKYKNLGYKWSLGLGIFGVTTGLIALKAQGISNKIFVGCASFSSIVLAYREFRLNKIYNWKQLEAHPKPQANHPQNELGLLQRVYQYTRKTINPTFEDSLEGLRWASNSLAEKSKTIVSHAISLLKNTDQESKNKAVQILAAEFLWESIQEKLKTAEARRLEDERHMKALVETTTTTGDVVNQALKIPRAVFNVVCSLF